MEYRQKLLAFNRCPYVRQLDELHKQRPVLKVVGVDRREIRHSRFLAWMFNDNELNAGSSESTVMHLLDAYIMRFDSQQRATPPTTITKKTLDKIEARSLVATNVKASYEFPTTGMKYNTGNGKKAGKKKGSIDLIIRGDLKDRDEEKITPFSIVIENKVDSDEHDEQTMKYFCYMTKEDNNGNAVFEDAYKSPLRENEVLFFIYLTPSTEDEMKEELDIACKEHYIHLSYQDIMDYVIVPIMDRNDLTDITRDNIEQYILCLGTTSALDDVQDNEDDELAKAKAKSTNVMAITKNHKELADKVWIEHQELITSALKAKRRKVWSDDMEPGDDILIAFWDSHSTFISTLLSVIAGYHDNIKTRVEAKKYYDRSLESKPKCFLNEEITDISKVAVEFAKQYCEYYQNQPDSPTTAEELSERIIADCKRYNCDNLPKKLFNPSNLSNSKVEIIKYKGSQIRFNKNTWSIPKFKNLLAFIAILNGKGIIKMNVEKA